jgi:hypothetical protein
MAQLWLWRRRAVVQGAGDTESIHDVTSRPCGDLRRFVFVLNGRPDHDLVVACSLAVLGWIHSYG